MDELVQFLRVQNGSSSPCLLGDETVPQVELLSPCCWEILVLAPSVEGATLPPAEELSCEGSLKEKGMGEGREENWIVYSGK